MDYLGSTINTTGLYATGSNERRKIALHRWKRLDKSIDKSSLRYGFNCDFTPTRPSTAEFRNFIGRNAT
jgi:hypothetical protein